MTVERPPRTRLIRRLRLAAGVVAGAIAFLLAGIVVVHLSPVRNRVLGFLASELATRGIHLNAANLDYNLARLSVTLDRPVLSA